LIALFSHTVAEFIAQSQSQYSFLCHCLIYSFLIALFSHTVAEFIAQSQSQYSFFLWEEGTPSACSLAQQESVLLNCLFSVYNPIAMDLIGFEMLHECLVSFNYSVLFVQNPTSSSTETTT